MYALAGYEVVTIYDQPNLEATKLGYLRYGRQVRCTPRLPEEDEHCKQGWHRLADGGFACASKGLQVSDKVHRMFRAPPAPRTDDPLPYEYGVVTRDGAGMWWRPPSRQERSLGRQAYAHHRRTLRSKRRGTAAPPSPRPKPPRALAGTSAPTTTAAAPQSQGNVSMPMSSSGTSPAAIDLPNLEDIHDAPIPRVATPAELRERERARRRSLRSHDAARKTRKTRAAELARKREKLPLHPQTPFLNRGYIVTLGTQYAEHGKSWWRTARGGYVAAEYVRRKRPTEFQGTVLAEGTQLPFGFVMAKEAYAYAQDDTGKLSRGRKLGFREFVDIVAAPQRFRGRTYSRTRRGFLVQTDLVRMAPQPDVPDPDLLAVEALRSSDVQLDLARAAERWIYVDLAKQILVAYEGENPVYTTLVSTGRRGSTSESFETPRGDFRIRTKHISSSMNGDTASDGDYSIQDVPWTMFFEGGYALHGAFWHHAFGRRRSHGCINLGPQDARWLFYWAGPSLPDTWHGVIANDGNPGTLVVVR